MNEPTGNCNKCNHEIENGKCITCGNYEEYVLHVNDYNVGSSDYSKHKIKPWDIWEEYQLDPWDADIVKRVLRTKPDEMILDYEKIIHICKKQIERINNGSKQN